MFMLSFISVIVCDLFNFWLKANLFFFPHHLITSLLPLRIKFSKRERVYILLTGIYQTHWVCVPVRSKDPNHMLCIFVFRGLRRERWLLVLLRITCRVFLCSEVIVSFVEDHMSCIFVFRGLRRERWLLVLLRITCVFLCPEVWGERGDC